MSGHWPWNKIRHKKMASYSQEGNLSLVYVYIRPEEKWPEKVSTETRTTEIQLDYDRATGELLGIEIITRTAASFAVH